MSSVSGFNGLTLNGVPINISTQSPGESRRELKSIQEGGPGGLREQLAWQPAGYPTRTIKRAWSFGWLHVRAFIDTLEELLSVPGPHRLCFWKHVYYSYTGDGSRVEFFLPHDIIVGDTAVNAILTETPSGRPIEEFEPVVRVEDAANLTVTTVSSGTYTTGPAAGNVYFLDGGAKFKLPEAPAAGETVYLRYVPYFKVLEEGENEKRYGDHVREPRSLALREV